MCVTNALLALYDWKIKMFSPLPAGKTGTKCNAKSEVQREERSATRIAIFSSVPQTRRAGPMLYGANVVWPFSLVHINFSTTIVNCGRGRCSWLKFKIPLTWLRFLCAFPSTSPWAPSCRHFFAVSTEGKKGGTHRDTVRWSLERSVLSKFLSPAPACALDIEEFGCSNRLKASWLNVN